MKLTTLTRKESQKLSELIIQEFPYAKNIKLQIKDNVCNNYTYFIGSRDTERADSFRRELAQLGKSLEITFSEKYYDAKKKQEHNHKRLYDISFQSDSCFWWIWYFEPGAHNTERGFHSIKNDKWYMSIQNILKTKK